MLLRRARDSVISHTQEMTMMVMRSMYLLSGEKDSSTAAPRGSSLIDRLSVSWPSSQMTRKPGPSSSAPALTRLPGRRRSTRQFRSVEMDQTLLLVLSVVTIMHTSSKPSSPAAQALALSRYRTSLTARAGWIAHLQKASPQTLSRKKKMPQGISKLSFLQASTLRRSLGVGEFASSPRPARQILAGRHKPFPLWCHQCLQCKLASLNFRQTPLKT